MRWNCPHCGVNLAIADEKIGSGWSFSRCYKCGGFGLIRRAEVNLIKVDRAPAGENVLLPEASEQPLSMLSESAIQNLTRMRKGNIEKTLLRDPSAAGELPLPLPSAAPQAQSAQMPPSMPEITESYGNFQKKVLAAAISVAAVATVSSGIYLYIQGQTLWQKARTSRSRIEPTSYRASEGKENTATSGEVSDHLHDRAMAPVRTSAIDSVVPQISAFRVAPKSNDAELRSGPGPIYPNIGTADSRQRYQVADWSNQWFKIVLPEGNGNSPSGRNQKTAWIRSDAVQVVPADSNNPSSGDFKK